MTYRRTPRHRLDGTSTLLFLEGRFRFAIMKCCRALPLVLIAACGSGTYHGPVAGDGRVCFGEDLEPGAERRTRADVYELAALEQRPAIDKYTSAALTRALASPNDLWEFLVAPETPYLDRLAAAMRGASVLGFEYLPRLMSARWELRKEEPLHYWGLRQHPFDSAARSPAYDVMLRVDPTRTILGRPWMIPAKRTEYPLLWQEECEAPWPWQVQQALGRLYNEFVWGARGNGSGWHEAALTMPCRTDEEAQRFVEATAAVPYFITLPVLARWRSIALHPEWPLAAGRVASSVSEVQRLWLDPRSGDVAALLALDILRSSPNEGARQNAAYSIAMMGKTVLDERKGPWDVRPRLGSMQLPPIPPIAASLLLELGRKGLDARDADEWSRLYAYVFSFCECLETSPIVVDRHMDPRSAAVHRSLETFAEWFRTREAELELASANEQPRWTELRNLLEASAKQ